MTTFSDDALVLHTAPYRDRHQIVAMLTPLRGVVRGVLRNARGGKRPLAAATQVLSLIRYSAYRAPRAELATFREVHLVRSSFNLSKNLSAAAAGAATAELLQSFFPEDEPASRPFRLGVAALDALLEGHSPALVVAYVQFWTLALSGLLPPLDCCVDCNRPLSTRFSVRSTDGQPICEHCIPNSPDRMDQTDLEFLQSCRDNPIQHNAPPSARTRAWLNLLVRREAERPLRALSFFVEELQ